MHRRQHLDNAACSEKVLATARSTATRHASNMLPICGAAAAVKHKYAWRSSVLSARCEGRPTSRRSVSCNFRPGSTTMGRHREDPLHVEARHDATRQLGNGESPTTLCESGEHTNPRTHTCTLHPPKSRGTAHHPRPRTPTMQNKPGTTGGAHVDKRGRKQAYEVR